MLTLPRKRGRCVFGGARWWSVMDTPIRHPPSGTTTRKAVRVSVESQPWRIRLMCTSEGNHRVSSSSVHNDSRHNETVCWFIVAYGLSAFICFSCAGGPFPWDNRGDIGQRVSIGCSPHTSAEGLFSGLLASECRRRGSLVVICDYKPTGPVRLLRSLCHGRFGHGRVSLGGSVCCDGL